MPKGIGLNHMHAGFKEPRLQVLCIPQGEAIPSGNLRCNVFLLE